jgi:hypothetical protein
MSSIAELIELLKEGSISKDQMLERIYSQSFPSKPDRFIPSAVTEIPSTKHENNNFYSDIEIDFNTNEIEDIKNGPSPYFEPSFSGYSPDAFIDRQNQWDFKKNFNKELLKEKKLKMEVKDCTFHPKTNVIAAKFSQDTIERLARIKETSRLLKIKEENEQLKIEEEMKACTFQPQINKGSSVSGSKYMSETPKKSPNYEQHTFVPKVRGPSSKMKTAKEYVKQDPFERLSRPKELYQPEPEEPELSVKSATPVPDYYGSSFSSRPFFERQALYELMKHEKKELLNSQEPNKPLINERSKKLVKNSFFERNSEMIQKKNTTKTDPDPCSFQPKITNQAKMRRNRSVAEMSYGDSKKKSDKIEFLKEQAEEKIRETVNPSTFQSKSYASVKSKLGIIDDPSSYIERIKAQQRKKEIEAQMIKEEKIKQDLSECTYAPAIIDAPSYVKQIARNMAMIKAELSVNKKSLKPEWK